MIYFSKLKSDILLANSKARFLSYLNQIFFIDKYIKIKLISDLIPRNPIIVNRKKLSTTFFDCSELKKLNNSTKEKQIPIQISLNIRLKTSIFLLRGCNKIEYPVIKIVIAKFKLICIV